MSVIRALAEAERFTCVLGVSPGFAQRRVPPLPVMELPRLESEAIGLHPLWRSQVVARAVRAWLHEEPVRIFHGHSRAGLLVALWLSRWGERRVVASVHCYGRQRWFYRMAARQLGARLYWLSPAMKRYYGIDAGSSWDSCIPPCISGAIPAGSRRLGERGDGIVRVSGAGMLVAWKGWHLMLEALAALPAPVRDRLRFAHIGSTDETAESARYAESLRAQTAALGLTKHVEWRGEQSSSRALLEQSDCAVVLSRADPFSMVMLEALALGVPVMASAEGGPTDVLRPGVNGWFFRPNDSADLARQLALLVESDLLEKTRVTSEDIRRFDATVVAEQWLQIYQREAGDRTA